MIRQKLLSSLWRHWATTQGTRPAFITPQATYSWGDVQQKAAQFAAVFFKQGVRSGDVIAIIGKNHPDSVFCYLAALQLGASVAFIAPQPLDKILIKLEILSGSTYQLWLIRLSTSGLTDIDCQVLSPLMQELTAGLSETGYLGFDYQPDQLASLIFTSGSTGQPKAVAHTSRQHLYSAEGLMQKFSFTSNDCWLLSLPLYHVSGLSILYRWLFAGATLKIGQGELLADMAEVSHASLVPVQLQRLLDAAVPLSLTHVLLGGSDIPLALAHQAQQRGIETWLGYGMTEAASTVTAKLVDEYHTTGKVLPNRSLIVKDKHIYIRGRTLASGYFRYGQVIPLKDSSGWFDSKDLGEWQGNELKIIGRADNQFISGGENIHCEEIEKALLSHPAVVNVIVAPVEDATYGARPVAVLLSRYALSVDELSRHLDDKLEKFKWPIAYYPMPENMMSGGIKISRVAIKEWLGSEYQLSML